jgi:hypothetical protein
LKRATDMSLFAVHSAQCHCPGRKRFRPPRPPHGDKETKRVCGNGQSDSGPWGNRQWDAGTMELVEQVKGTMHNGTIGFGELGLEHWDNGTLDTGTMDQ